MYAVAVAIVFVSAMGYLLTKTYHARMLIVERKRMGLVRSSNSNGTTSTDGNAQSL